MKKTRHEDFVWNVKESDGIIKPLGGILIEMVNKKQINFEELKEIVNNKN